MRIVKNIDKCVCVSIAMRVIFYGRMVVVYSRGLNYRFFGLGIVGGFFRDRLLLRSASLIRGYKEDWVGERTRSMR